ncbi:hypothetical protein BpHYR1_049353 [Brachionus plicatilis]|uniref:Tc1-like transposase DDE domain-containing protein n=1 Tax=Brachionus plicatilis TaxID=10195 RepID=A0A3M7SJX7_BRAPC|nr:hypothetical protein BpHYR1_049353 [Brachionus plicatilis]
MHGLKLTYPNLYPNLLFLRRIRVNDLILNEDSYMEKKNLKEKQNFIYAKSLIFHYFWVDWDVNMNSELYREILGDYLMPFGIKSPPKSPDINPIDLFWNELKVFVR